MFTYRCICGLLKDRLVILVTHQVQFALQTSKLLALKEVCIYNVVCLRTCSLTLDSLFKGRTEVYGSHSELVAMGVDPSQLLGLITHQKEEEDQDQFCIKDDRELLADEGDHV